MTTSMDFLHKILVFDGLDDQQLGQVAGCCREMSFHRKERIFEDGNKAENLYIVMEGRVDLRFEVPGAASSEADTITSVRPGQIMGWSALTHSPIYSLSAYCATEHCDLVVIGRECILALFEEDSRMGYVVMGNVAEVIRARFHQLQEELGRRKGCTPVARW